MSLAYVCLVGCVALGACPVTVLVFTILCSCVSGGSCCVCMIRVDCVPDYCIIGVYVCVKRVVMIDSFDIKKLTRTE